MITSSLWRGRGKRCLCGEQTTARSIIILESLNEGHIRPDTSYFVERL